MQAHRGSLACRCVAAAPAGRTISVLFLALVAAATGGSGEQAGAASPRLHFITFMNRLDRRFAFLQVSAESHGFNPQVIGYGMEAWWPDGLGAKINALRRFVHSRVKDSDVVVFADAFDVIVFGGEEEIISRFEDLEARSNRSLVFNAEEVCFPRREGVCDNATYPLAPHRWRFLNSGLIAGRGHALKAMLRDPVPDVIDGSDQFWYQQYFAEHQSTVLLDTECQLFCAIWGLDQAEHGVVFHDGRIHIPETGTMPSLVHFVSLAHWTHWEGGKATSTLHQVFRELYPQASRTLLDKWWIGVQIGSTHDIMAYDGPGWWVVIRTILCVQCNLLGSTESECHYFRGLFSEYCWWPALLMFLLTILLSALVGRCCRLAAQKQDGGLCGCEHSTTLPLPVRRLGRWFRMQLTQAKKPELIV